MNSTNNIISVIVPVYKSEQYLDKCIESVVNQTYKDLEIILVDDGSPDLCPQMCDKWALKDSRIKVIHKELDHVCEARNMGLDIASGNYISWVDSDDYLELDMYEKMLEYKGDADIVIANYYEDFEDKRQEGLKFDSYLLGKDFVDATTTITYIYERVLGSTAMWNKLFSAELLKEPVPVPKFQRIEGKYSEDALWSTIVISRAQKVKFLNIPFYHYMIRNGSTTRGIKNTEDRLIRCIDSNKIFRKVIHEYVVSNEVIIECVDKCLLKNLLWIKYISYINKYTVSANLASELIDEYDVVLEKDKLLYSLNHLISKKIPIVIIKIFKRMFSIRLD